MTLSGHLKVCVAGDDFKTGFSAQILHASALMACSHYVGYTSASGFFRSSNTGYTHEINLVTYVRKSLGFFSMRSSLPP